jgi:iron complex transport system substrate-binding protein
VLVGQAVGKLEQAEKLVDDLTQRFADLAAAHPQFEGTTAAFVNAPYDDSSVIAWPNGLGTGFLTDLGFTIPSSIDKFVSEGQAQAEIPAKDATVLNDAKVLIWGDETEDGSAIRGDKVLGKLTAVEEGRSVYADELLTSAIYFGSILSLPYVLDTLVPELERILPA